MAKIQGITLQLVDKNNGRAVDRQWFKNLNKAYEWLNQMYPNWDKRYNVELFSD